MVETKKIVKYAALPGFIPRLHALFTSGFVHIAYLIATIYRAVGLLPPNHAYLDPANRGKFGISHVIVAAYRNLKFTKKNIDQIFIFFTLALGFVLLVAQFALLVVSVIASQPALAQDNIFTIDGSIVQPDQDIAFIIMDRVFGLQGIFDSCVSTASECLDSDGIPIPGSNITNYPTPFHIALHKMLQFYSTGIFFVAVMVIIYLVAAIAGETASSGTPFGKRFNKTWAPIRIIFFFALITPLNFASGQNEGLNAAQLIVFHTAKFGSNFATNAWVKFNTDLNRNYLGQTADLVALPNIPEINELARLMFVAKTCKIAQEQEYTYADGQGIQAYLVRPSPFGTPLINSPTGGNYWRISDASYEEALKFNNNGNILIRFGEHNPDKHSEHRGDVEPTCGQVLMRTAGAEGPLSGVTAVQEAYFDLVKDMWVNPLLTHPAACLYKKYVPNYNGGETTDNCEDQPDREDLNALIRAYHETLKEQLPTMVEAQANNPRWAVEQTLLDRGWGGAGIWYNRIAQLNGNVTTAVFNIPTPNTYPAVMEHIAASRAISNEENDPDTIYDPLLQGGEPIDYNGENDEQIAIATYKAFRFWEDSGMDSPFKKKSGNVIIDTINYVFGTYGLFDMVENADKHPLAQISTLGKGMVEATVRNIGLGLPGMGIGAILGKDTAEGILSDTAGGFLYAVGMLMIVYGVILFYIVPFLPFIYFFFAISGWVKSIFEAIVAMPIWALAHLQIDGEGSIGKFASNGYFLIFEILIRPILIVVGLLASLSIFAATVEVLNDIFVILVKNVSGYNFELEQNNQQFGSDYMRGPVDQFFYSALYAAIVYLLGISCFKLIDLIPNNILRWMGNTTATFQESAGDPAGDVLKKTYQGGTLLTTNLKGGRLAAVIGAGG